MALASLPGYRIRLRGGSWREVRAARFVVGCSPRAHLEVAALAPRHLRVELGDDGVAVRALEGPVAIGGVPVLAAPVADSASLDAGGAVIEIERSAPWSPPAANVPGLDAAAPLRRLAIAALAEAMGATRLVIEGARGAGATTAAGAVAAARGRGPLIAIDCAGDVDDVEPTLFGEAMARLGLGRDRGAFDDARGGTLLLEHLDAVDPSLYTRLVAALDRAEDVAVIATMRDLDVSDLPAPLYDRLAIARAWLPPLEATPEDLFAFADRFARAATPDPALPRDLPRILGARRWRGNLTELRAFMTRLVREVP